MYLNDADKAKYPDFNAWLRDELPSIPSKRPKVWQAFRKHAGAYSWLTDYLPGSSGPLFLSWGFEPRIGGYNWECEKDGDPAPKSPGSDILIQRYEVKWYGFTSPKGSVILVADDLARGAMDPVIQPVLEATVLHELVHWTRLMSGQDVYDEGPPYEFEKEAYGHVVRRTWATCYSPEMYIPKP